MDWKVNVMYLHVQIRKLKKSDLDDCIVLFRNTVHAINSKDYNQCQLDAWAPSCIDKSVWWESLSKNIAYVAEYQGKIVGFGDMSREGYFDRLFVHKDFQRKGIASALIKKIEDQARVAGIQEVNTEVSVTAKPLMEAFGYQLITKQIKEYNGQKFINFIMKKSLSLCPCCSNQNYAQCCGIYINAFSKPDTPEKLMRSRYTAYTQANIDYIKKTMKSPALNYFDAESAKQWAVAIQWLGLEVINSTIEKGKGYVEFIAHMKEKNKKKYIHEISEFHQFDGQWYYVNGKHIE